MCRAQELCESRDGHPGLPVPNKLYGFFGHVPFRLCRAQELCESRDGHPGLPVPNKLDGFVNSFHSECAEVRSCVKVEMAIPGPLSLISFMVLWTRSIQSVRKSGAV